MIWFFAVALVCALGIAWLARPKAAVSFLFVVLLASNYAGFAALMGEPKPLYLEWRAPASPEVIAATWREGEAIYLWLDVNGAPVAYVLPWDTRQAQALHQALQSRDGAVADGLFRGLFDRSLEDREPVFHPKPVQALPPKGGE